ncbi:MAG TPA: ASCH domain-containing protein [Gaiellaceae bacterium]|jgi:uncharacterized protein YhfF
MRRAEFGFAGTDLRRRLVEAILRGEKTATAGLLEEHEQDGEAVPEVGERQLLVDEHDAEVGVIETTEVRIIPIREVDLPFAVDEGEGFETVAEWRVAHERFWTSYWGPVDDDTLIVAERFRLVERF